jgi:hypothetical protein
VGNWLAANQKRGGGVMSDFAQQKAHSFSGTVGYAVSTAARLFVVIFFVAIPMAALEIWVLPNNFLGDRMPFIVGAMFVFSIWLRFGLWPLRRVAIWVWSDRR